MVVIAAAIVGWGVHQLTAPVHGRPTSGGTVPRTKRLAKPAVLPASNLQNDYFQLALPTGYRVQAGNAETPGILYTQTLIKPANFGSLIVVIAVKAMPEGGLSEDSSYRLRSQQTTRYKLSSQTLAGESVQIANDSQAAAVVAFWPHSGYLATISVTSGISDPGADDNADQVAALRTLLAAWQWR